MKKKIKTVGITFNLKKKGTCREIYEEYDEIETIQALSAEIARHGFKVILFEQISNLARDILKKKPDFVVNIAEGLGTLRGRESQVPCLLESLNIPYWGSDAISLAISLDKYLSNTILKSKGVPVPYLGLINREQDLVKYKKIFSKYKKMIVKPRWEGSSKGIFCDSIVSNYKELKAKTQRVLKRYHQPAVIEEFLEREEVTVGICGNSPPKLIGMTKITPRNGDLASFCYSLENKRDWEKRIAYESCQTISPKLRREIAQCALKAFNALEIKDMARIDFRISKSNIPKVIDVNPLPGLSPRYSDLPIIYRMQGGNYSNLITMILKSSFKRYKLALK